MKGAFFKSIDDIILKDIKIRPLGDSEIRVKVDACGVCGTDVTSVINGAVDYAGFGHEIAGTILEAGSAVKNVKPGQKVALESSSACGECGSCRNDRQDLCAGVMSFGGLGYLGFAEELISPAKSAVLYDGISAEEACLSEPLGVAIDMHRLCDIKTGDHVVVSGLGTIGLMAVRLAKLSGAARIYAINLSPSKVKFETAKKFGADEVISLKETPLEKCRFERPPDRFMVTSPPGSLEAMIGIAARGAIISYIGIKYGDGAVLRFDANDFHFKKLQLRGSFASPALFTPMALTLLKNKMIDGRSLITHTFPLKDIKEALRVAAFEHDKAIKVVVKP